MTQDIFSIILGILNNQKIIEHHGDDDDDDDDEDDEDEDDDQWTPASLIKTLTWLSNAFYQSIL